jgi:hypothetical protein
MARRAAPARMHARRRRAMRRTRNAAAARTASSRCGRRWSVCGTATLQHTSLACRRRAALSRRPAHPPSPPLPQYYTWPWVYACVVAWLAAVGSEADKAGLRGTSRSRAGAIELGDIIIEIDGDHISNEVSPGAGQGVPTCVIRAGVVCCARKRVSPPAP